MPDGDAYWIDAGTPETYLQVQLDLVDGRQVAGARPPVVVDPTASIAGSATVRRSVVGPGASIEDGAEVVDSVVGAGARIGAHASVRRAIIGPRGVVRPDAKVEELTVIGDGEVVP
jgi:NDP-sugar pyrophosphorylase family protein